MTLEPCTKEEALAAVRVQAFTEEPEQVYEQCGEDDGGPLYRDVTPPGRQTVHCFMGFIGADWNLGEVEIKIERADELGWINHLLGHDLWVRVGKEEFCFQAKQKISA